MKKIVILSGSPSASSRLVGALTFVHQQLVVQGHAVEWVNIRDLPPEDLIYAQFNSPHIQDVHQAIALADGVIVASPVYKASYTGLLKSYLDLLPTDAFSGKVVFPLMIGGTPAHLLALEYALKPLCAVLGSRNVLQGVYVLESEVVRADDGEFQLDSQIKQRLAQNAIAFGEELFHIQSQPLSQKAVRQSV
ncbi:NADPH-dependent FMN reductase [Alicyclobacillus fodiniaquatilis]|uniref:NADPH-dependent FMN reductase n=1 Tax=Alicyclobacillus fodiniaquatilis TaxID=1661150 RepID=A0ABW4JNZ1_9BACL